MTAYIWQEHLNEKGQMSANQHNNYNFFLYIYFIEMTGESLTEEQAA